MRPVSINSSFTVRKSILEDSDKLGFFNLLIFMCISVLPTCISVQHCLSDACRGC